MDSNFFGVLETETNSPETFFDSSDFGRQNPRFTSLKILSQSSSTWKISKFEFQTSRRLLGGMEWFLVRWKQKRNPPRRFSIHPILVDGTLRFTSSKFGGFRKNPRIDRFLAKCYILRGYQKLSESTKYLPKTSFGTYNPNVRKCQNPFKPLALHSDVKGVLAIIDKSAFFGTKKAHRNFKRSRRLLGGF